MTNKEIPTKTMAILLVFTLIVVMSGTWVVVSNVSPEVSAIVTGSVLDGSTTGYTTTDIPEEPELNETLEEIPE